VTRFVLTPATLPRILAAVSNSPPGAVITIREGDTRTLDQNAALWARLGDVAAQVEWYGKRLSADDWKCVFSAALKRSQVVPGLDGGFVVVGQSTSRMSKREFSDMLELITAFGACHGVKWSDSREEL